jgi:outer membrane protein OmpA-like peptidoglycan-associated protein
MTKSRELLLACSVLALAIGAMPVLAEPGFQLAQAQQTEKDKDKSKQPAKGQPAKGQPQQQTQPPAAKGPPPAARPQPSTATPSQQAPERKPAAAPTAPSRPSQSQQPAARTQPGQAPAARQETPATQPGQRDRRPSTAQQPGQEKPSATQDQRERQQRPATREQAKPPSQQPAQAPATQTQPSTTQTQPGQPGQQQRPAAREQRPTTTQQQPGQAPAAQGQPGQPQRPVGRDDRRRPGDPQPTQRAQPPAPAQPPATQQTQPQQQPQTQQPAARTQPPAGQPGQQPTAQDKLAPGTQAPRQAVAPTPMGAQGQPLRRVDDLRGERRETREGNRVVIREPDRMIIREGGRAIIRHNETDRFRRGGGREVAVDRRGNEVMTIVERPDGTRIITVVDNDGRLIRRTRRTREGREIVIIDNRFAPRGRVDYFVELPPPVIRIPRERYIVEADRASRDDVYAALMAPPVDRIERRYTLDEVRYSPALRDRMPRVDLDTITFESGSWELGPEQIDQLAVIAEGINQAIASNPAEVFLIEGHTDAVGAEEDNLSLSDRRAEAVAMALTEQFQVPAENLTTQGYGEQQLKVPTQGPDERNRRVTARRITPLLTGGQGSVGQAN